MKSADKKEKRQENQTDFENTEGETEQKCLVSPSFLRLGGDFFKSIDCKEEICYTLINHCPFLHPLNLI